ncbi:MAG: cytochrome P450 [Deltaproteobacteria bacterium]|nr:cytochrome P450 [Deltaproteobacteria bacterium]
MSAPRWPQVSGAKPGSGHFEEFNAHPAHFMWRAYRECGELAEFDLGGAKHLLLSSPAAYEAVFRAGDDQLSPREPYHFMVPVFGAGIQYGAPLELERQQVKMQSNALRLDRMKSYAQVIAREVEAYVSTWDDEGEKDFYEELKELVLRTSTHCLMGSEFRAKLTGEFGALYQDLEHAVSASSIVDPYAQEEAFAKRDRSRARLAQLVTAVIEERRRTGASSPDMLQSFMEAAYLDGRRLTDDEIVGMVIWIMFAGFHTSSNTATWTLVELARNPQHAARVVREIDAVVAPGSQLAHTALRELPALERFVFEVLRKHPPLVTLMRLVKRDLAFRDVVIPAGSVVVVSPYVAHRLPESFPDAERFDPERAFPENVFAYIPFGGGRRKCVGNAFALLQVKAIFAALLARYEFELVDAPESYQDVMPSLILRTSDPCRLRYRRRGAR